MNAKMLPGIPEQIKGAYHDTESRKKFDTSEETAEKFSLLKARFFSVNCWKDYCGPGSSDFRLYDAAGRYTDRPPRQGDFMRIDIPGPGDPQANGYDWVEVTDFDDRAYGGDELERILITCRPSPEPGSGGKDVAHFYDRLSSSTFIISRGRHFIQAGIYGRNEIANSTEKNFWGRIRNFVVSLGGYAKVTKLQWKNLAEGLLNV